MNSDTLTLDHAAHFVPDIDAAGAALEKLGFTLTPFSAQSVRPESGGEPVPAGTGNRCMLFQQGYLEILAPTHDTPNAGQLRAAIQRYTGMHLIAFGTDDAVADHTRLTQQGFGPLPPIALQREGGTIRFTVVRVPPGTMAEGRVQYCQHHTPELVWQKRWIHHRNGITGLTGIILCVADPEEAARRYARFTGLDAQCDNDSGGMWRLDTARGYLLFASAETVRQHYGIAAPALPWIAGSILQSTDFPATLDVFRASDAHPRKLADNRALIELPPALGGIMIVQ